VEREPWQLAINMENILIQGNHRPLAGPWALWELGVNPSLVRVFYSDFSSTDFELSKVFDFLAANLRMSKNTIIAIHHHHHVNHVSGGSMF
jgi:hypothetical protein